MKDRGPWAVVADAAIIASLVVCAAIATLQLAPVAPLFASIERYLQGRGFSQSAAENFAAGAIQTLIELVFLTGAFTLAALVGRAIQHQSIQTHAARQVFNVYSTFIKRLQYLHRPGGRSVPTTPFLSFKIAQFSRALDALQVRPLYFAGALPQDATEAFDEALGDLESFYQFADSLTSWANAPNAPDATKAFVLRPAKENEPAPLGADAFVKLHGHMIRFFSKIPTPGDLKKRLRGDLSKQMAEMGAAHPFIVVERRATGSP